MKEICAVHASCIICFVQVGKVHEEALSLEGGGRNEKGSLKMRGVAVLDHPLQATKPDSTRDT